MWMAVVVVGLISVAFATAGAITGNGVWWIWSIGALGVSLLSASMSFVARPSVPAVSFAAAVVTAGIQGFTGDPAFLLVATVVFIGALTTAVATVRGVSPEMRALVAGASVVVVALWWTPSLVGLFNAAVMGLVAAWTTWILSMTRRSFREESKSRRATKHGLESLPIPVIETNIKSVVEGTRHLVARHGVAIGDYLNGHPEIVENVTGWAFEMSSNAAAQELTNTRPEDYPKRMTGGSAGYAIDVLTEWLMAIAGGKQRFQREFQIEVAGQYRWYQSSMPMPSGPADDGSVTYHSFVDVTGIRESQAQLQLLIESKDKFVATVAHEIRTPLAAVMGFASEIPRLDPTEDAGMVRELSNMVAGQSKEIAHIVEDLLVFARADLGSVSVNPTLMNATDSVSEILGELENLVDTAEVGTDGVGDLRVNADPVRVKQILRNLVVNAFRHGAPPVRIGTGTEGGLGVIEVRDRGAGIPDAVAGRIFDAYVSGSSDGSADSIGLGLHVSTKLAELMGGDLVHSRLGDETVFRLRLPLR